MNEFLEERREEWKNLELIPPDLEDGGRGQQTPLARRGSWWLTPSLPPPMAQGHAFT